MIKIAWVKEAEIPCEPGAELCNECIGGCNVRIKDNVCTRFDELVYHSPNDDFEQAHRCPACLRAERRAVLRARFAKQE